MSQEDSLRMVAEVVDRFSSPLRNLRGQLQGMSREGAAHAETLTKGFNRLEGATAAAARTSQTVLTPALSSVGITALTVTGALAGVGAAMRSFGQGATQVAQLGRDTGIAAQQLREIQGILGRVGVDANQSGAAITQFAENMRQARKGVGPVLDFFRQYGGRSAESRAYFDGLAESLRNSKDNGEALSKALGALEHIPDPLDRRKYAEGVLGLGDAARLADGHLGSLREQIERFRRDNGILSQEDIEKAEAYDRAMAGLRGSMNKLGDAIAREAMPHLSDLAKNLKSFLDDERQGATPAITGAIRDVADGLRGIDWKTAFSTAGEGLSKLRTDLTTSVADIRSLLRDLGNKEVTDPITTMFKTVGDAATSTGKAIRDTATTLRALKDMKDGNWDKGWDRLRGIEDGWTDKWIGPRKNFDTGDHKPSAQDEQLDAMIRGQPGSAEDQHQAENLRANAARVREIEARQQALRDKLGNFDRLGQGAISERSRQEAERLRDEMARLTAEMKRLREGQAQQKRESEATAQKSSFGEGDGQPGLGGLIQKASLGSTSVSDPFVMRRFQAFLQNRGYSAQAAEVGRMLRERQGGINLPEVRPDSPLDRLGRQLRGEDGGGLAGRDFGGGRFGLGGPARPGGMLRPGGPGERVGRMLRGEPAAPSQGANPGDYKDVLDYIAKQEGTAGGKNNGYDVTLANGALLPGGREQDLTKMTLDQVDAMQRGMLQHPGNRWNSSAAGRYQIVRRTLRGLRRNLGLRGDELYDEQMQDRLAAELARARGANAKGLGDEWASLKGAKGLRVAELMAQVRPGASTQPRPRVVEQADGEGFAARMRAMRSFEGKDFASEVRRRQGEADERAKAFSLGTETKMQSALRAGVGAATPNVNANGSVQIDIREPGPNTKVRTSASGELFRTVKLNKGRAMAEASQGD